jgi:hypothetical protein
MMYERSEGSQNILPFCVQAGAQLGGVEVGAGELDDEVVAVLVVQVLDKVLEVVLVEGLTEVEMGVEEIADVSLEVTEVLGGGEDAHACNKRLGVPLGSDILPVAAIETRICLTSAGEREVFVLQIWARTPATWGEAIEVPVFTDFVPFLSVEVISTPGAMMPTQGP